MSLTLYELPPSPNSIKVRSAHGRKGIACSRQSDNPADRAQVAHGGLHLGGLFVGGVGVHFVVLLYLPGQV